MNGDRSGAKNTLDRVTISLCCGSIVQQLTVEKCSRLFHQRLRNIIEAELSLAHRRYPLLSEISQVGVDIGEIPLLQFEAEFCRRFAVEFQHCLDEYGEAHSARRPSAIENTTKAANLSVKQDETVLHASFDRYLDHGYWSQPEAWIRDGGADEWLLAERETDPDRWRALIARACLFPQRRRRLLRLLSHDTLRKCLSSVGPVDPFSLVVEALRYFQHNPQQHFPQVKVDLKVVEASVSGNEEPLIALFSSTPSSASVPWLRAIWERPPIRSWLEKCLPVRQIELLQQLLEQPGEQETERMPTQEIPKPQPIDGQNRETAIKPPALHWNAALNLATVPVANAGLVLLWPLLPDLFARLGLWEKDRFVSAQARINAACWLDMTIWADDCACEWRMALTRWLCGLPLESEIDWRAPDPAQAEQLQNWLPSLAGQIPAWRTLKEIDIRALFLQRAGRLEHPDCAGSAMTLVVEPEPFDVLLTDWPWPLETIMLPWLEQPLSVHWQSFPA